MTKLTDLFVVRGTIDFLKAAEARFLITFSWVPKEGRWIDPEDGSEWDQAEALKLQKSRLDYDRIPGSIEAHRLIG